jgi:hypothetical protein
MTRVRISTTVDGERLQQCRRLVAGHDSQLMDQALEALIEKLEARLEDLALSARPYEGDPDLAWVAPPGPDLPYDGEVPADVLRLAKRRGRGRGRER